MEQFIYLCNESSSYFVQVSKGLHDSLETNLVVVKWVRNTYNHNVNIQESVFILFYFFVSF